MGLSNQLNEAFPDIVPVLRPSTIMPPKISDFNWFAGFTDAGKAAFILF